MTKAQMSQMAATLEQQAAQNDRYARAMEETSARTGGALGSVAAPNNYAAHIKAAADKRSRAAKLREDASNL